MKKIFKYEVLDGFATVPVNSHTIRMDHVDDGFYKGDFVWAIVDTADLEDTIAIEYKPDPRPVAPYGKMKQLAVKEKQIIEDMIPHTVGELDGRLYMSGAERPGVKYEVCFFKTGQEIDICVEKYLYIGLCRLWIVQELGLYTFVRKIT